MTTTEACNQIVGFVDNVSTTDAANLERLTRALQYVQEGFNDAYHHAEWWFRWKLFAVTVAANATSGVLDTTFSDLPANSDGGSVYNTATGQKLRIVRPSKIHAYQQNPADSVSGPDECAVYGMHTASPYNALLQVRKQGAALSLNVWGHVKPPVLALGDDKLDKIPSQWHQTVIIPAARMFAQKSKGDAKEWQSHYERGLARMKAVENQVKGGNFAFPGFFGW